MPCLPKCIRYMIWVYIVHTGHRQNRVYEHFINCIFRKGREKPFYKSTLRNELQIYINPTNNRNQTIPIPRAQKKLTWTDSVIKIRMSKFNPGHEQIQIEQYYQNSVSFLLVVNGTKTPAFLFGSLSSPTVSSYVLAAQGIWWLLVPEETKFKETYLENKFFQYHHPK